MFEESHAYHGVVVRDTDWKERLRESEAVSELTDREGRFAAKRAYGPRLEDVDTYPFLFRSLKIEGTECSAVLAPFKGLLDEVVGSFDPGAAGRKMRPVREEYLRVRVRELWEDAAPSADLLKLSARYPLQEVISDPETVSNLELCVYRAKTGSLLSIPEFLEDRKRRQHLIRRLTFVDQRASRFHLDRSGNLRFYLRSDQSNLESFLGFATAVVDSGIGSWDHVSPLHLDYDADLSDESEPS